MNLQLHETWVLLKHFFWFAAIVLHLGILVPTILFIIKVVQAIRPVRFCPIVSCLVLAVCFWTLYLVLPIWIEQPDWVHRLIAPGLLSCGPSVPIRIDPGPPLHVEQVQSSRSWPGQKLQKKWRFYTNSDPRHFHSCAEQNEVFPWERRCVVEDIGECPDF